MVDNKEEQDPDLWKDILTEAKLSFQNGLTSIQETRDRAIELIKIDLLLGSFYVALFQFGGDELRLASDSYLVALLFAPLLLSMFLFLYGYFTLGTHTIGVSSGNAYEALSKKYDQPQYFQMMSVIYLKWGDKNTELNHKAVNYLVIGIGSIFASLGAVVGIFLLI